MKPTCTATRDLGYGVVLRCQKSNGHRGEHLERDDKHRRTFWLDDKPSTP